ncbi:unnamed protein product, partial [Mesorhabditis spiculigera]
MANWHDSFNPRLSRKKDYLPRARVGNGQWVNTGRDDWSLARAPIDSFETGYFGAGDSRKDDRTIETFAIDVSPDVVDDWKERFKNERRLPALPYGNHGISESLKKLLDENLAKFDWKQHQYFLNTFKQYRTEIEGLKMHYLRPALPPVDGKLVVPLVLLHGFPGNFWHFYKVIPFLSNPSRHGFDFGVRETIIFDVIVPSLPGFLWSEKPTRSGLWTAEAARILSKLLTRLEITSAFIHGGSILGTDVAAAMGALYPKQVRGLHLSNPILPPLCDLQTGLQSVLASFAWLRDEDREATGLLEQQNIAHLLQVKNADALGVALHNSPQGQLIYLMARWADYSRNGTKELNQMYTVDELLTESALYWLTDSLPHALRFLENSSSHPDRCQLALATVSRPTAICQTPDAPFRTSRALLGHKFHNITRYNTLPKGGLFHSLQDAHSLAADIFSFVEREYM